MNVNIDMKDVKEFLCPECNGNLFEKIWKVLFISKLIPANPTGKDFLKPVAQLKCANKKCGHVLKGITPV